jgi:cytoskeletal protein CcmA (bactofilin family)
MARSPFAPPLPATPASPASPAAATSPLRPNLGASSPAPREEGARRTLVVGRGISVQGTVQDAERLVVEGTVEATMINGLTELSIAHGGMFKGEVEVDEAEVAGTIDGTLVARQSLVVRASGRVLGTARCRRLQVEDGGQITGRIEMLNDGASPAPFSPIISKVED